MRLLKGAPCLTSFYQQTTKQYHYNTTESYLALLTEDASGIFDENA